MEALAVPAGIARVTKKNMVGLSPGMYMTGFTTLFVQALLFCSHGIVGCVDSEPVVAAAKSGSG